MSRKVATKVTHFKHGLFTHIPAQMAMAGPPLGTQLGQLGVNIANFIKDFNLKTSIFRAGIPLPCHVTINPDRKWATNIFKLDILSLLKMHHSVLVYVIKNEIKVETNI